MNPQDRREKILKLLHDNYGKLTLKELSRHFNISQSALYKDLDILQKQRYIKKIYGGIELIDINMQQHNYYRSLQVNVKQKTAIAKEAVKLVSSNETIFIDGSSTTFYLCEELKKQNYKNITVITNSIFIPHEFILQENFNVICTGGMLNKEIGVYCGDLWESVLINNFHANKFFFSTYGISADIGVLDSFVPGETSMKKIFSKNASKNICLADSNKFMIKGAINWISFENIDVLISDNLMDGNILNVLKTKKIQLVLANLK
ncbi:DeoR/GlpR family DNA-binding transcription regulator [bacterium]|nr:DeoR/GlpR family DNA-binding transcription regulator [bacterium]